MRIKTLRINAILLVSIVAAASVMATAQMSPRNVNEAFTATSMRILHSAQATYAATYGNGNYGSLANLEYAGLIDAALASGSKYGFVFIVTHTTYSPPTPASFTVTAVPRIYRKTGFRSFYVATDGIIRGADRQGAPADANDPEVDLCAPYGITCRESATIRSLRSLHSAQMTYHATYGSGRFGSLAELFAVRLIFASVASGTADGYSLTLTTIASSKRAPATFAVSAVPTVYGSTGIRSFYIDQTGVVRGADRGGLPALPTDPPLE